MDTQLLVVSDLSRVKERYILKCFEELPFDRLLDFSFDDSTSTKLKEVCFLKGRRYSKMDIEDLVCKIISENLEAFFICSLDSTDVLNCFRILKNNNYPARLILLD